MFASSRCRRSRLQGACAAPEDVVLAPESVSYAVNREWRVTIAITYLAYHLQMYSPVRRLSIHFAIVSYSGRGLTVAGPVR
jgi:hypothetical protein